MGALLLSLLPDIEEDHPSETVLNDLVDREVAETIELVADTILDCWFLPTIPPATVAPGERPVPPANTPPQGSICCDGSIWGFDELISWLSKVVSFVVVMRGTGEEPFRLILFGFVPASA